MKFELERTMELLERTPMTVGALLEGLSDSWLEANEGPDTFSPRDVLGHLIHGEETDWVPRIKIILAHGPSRPFDAFDRFGFRGKIRGKSLSELLARFESLRLENLQFLRELNLDPVRLQLKGTHPELGPVTLGELLATWAVHDLGHIAQIARVLSKQYREAVGPWRQYISILDWGPHLRPA